MPMPSREERRQAKQKNKTSKGRKTTSHKTVHKRDITKNSKSNKSRPTNKVGGGQKFIQTKMNFQKALPVYFFISLVVLAGLTTGIIIIGIRMNGTTTYDFGDDDIDYRYTYDYDYETGEYTTDTIFVSPIGDNTTGGNWETAYTDLWTALSEASTHTNNMTMIHVGKGDYDLNLTGTPTVNANIIFRGCCLDDLTTITNTHASADAIIKFTKVIYLQHLEFQIEGTTVDYGIIHTDTHFFMDYSSVFTGVRTSAVELIRVVGAESIYINNVVLQGDTTKVYSTNLRLINCSYGGVITNNRFILGNIGIRSDNSDRMRLEHNTFRAQNTSFLIDSLSSSWDVAGTHFTSNTYEINSTAYVYFHEHDTVLDVYTMILTPDNTTGVEATGHADVDTWGDWSNMTYTPTKWFKIAGGVFDNPSDAAAYYRISMRTWNGLTNEHNVLGDFILESGKTGSFPISIGSGILPQGSILSYRIMTSDGGADTIEAFARVVEF